jgi:hypothetical protein
MRAGALAIQMLILAARLAAADPFSALVPPARLAAVRAGAEVWASLPEDGRPVLIPAVPSAASLSAEIRALRPTVGAELLTVLPFGAGDAGSPEGRLRLYNALHAVSSMRGVTYWSVTRSRQEVLFLQSSALDAGGGRVADPVFASIPPVDVLRTYQEDSSFGRNTFRERFTLDGDALVVKMENESAITMLLLPLVKPGGLVSMVVLVPRDGEVLFYGAACLKTGFPMGDRRARVQSLKNRLDAMAAWLQARLLDPPPAGE